MEVSIIIVNFKTPQLTKNCIDSIKKFTSGIDYEIILVDNNSGDGSEEIFKKIEDITYIQATENLGFGRANNLGLKSAAGELILFLNSDTVLLENSVKKMFDFFRHHEDKLGIGSLGLTLIDRNKEMIHSAGDLPTAVNLLSSYFQNFFIKDFHKRKNVKEVSEYRSEIAEVGYVTGADLMVRKEVFESIENFDPDFFMYYEDALVGHRLRQIGKKNYICNCSQIVHLEGESFKTPNLTKRIMVEKSMFIYVKKTSGKFGYFLFRMIFMLINFPILILKFWRTGSWRYLKHLISF
ncbi:glycosyltransferase family 2 protein [Chryseobacterium sp. R2A-55]|uniref:glycosyltransferase family 2 protein n=1 Tax=Chryseobacterium sp. R2A-55 TaxID=2744445 RepID=UPI001F16CA7B|nr:glycosyltransferase family 2 protein [Chryseobacterium sp. R2A-55]